MKKNRAAILKILYNNKGSTMMETIVSFVVLMIVLAALYSMVRFSSELRMRAVDSARIQSNFNEQLYRNDNNMQNIKKYVYIGKHAKDTYGNSDTVTVFTIKLNDKKTDVQKAFNSNNMPADNAKESIKLPNVNATGYVCTDPIVDMENVIAPRVLSFKHYFDTN